MILINKIMKIFKDMLMEGGKYSQGRVYLFWSVIAYYITFRYIISYWFA